VTDELQVTSGFRRPSGVGDAWDKRSRRKVEQVLGPGTEATVRGTRSSLLRRASSPRDSDQSTTWAHGLRSRHSAENSLKAIQITSLLRRLIMQRRDFLIQTGLASLAPAATQTGRGSRPDLKITDIKTYLVGVGSRNLLFVKVETDQGLHGIG